MLKILSIITVVIAAIIVYTKSSIAYKQDQKPVLCMDQQQFNQVVTNNKLKVFAISEDQLIRMILVDSEHNIGIFDAVNDLSVVCMISYLQQPVINLKAFEKPSQPL